MRKRTWFVVTAALALTAAFLLGRWLTPVPVEAQQQPTRVAAVPGEKGGQDMYGAYEPVAGWPKPLSSVPGVGKWTWGAGQGVFAESPNRVFVLQRGMLPEVERPKTVKIAPSVEFPIGRLRWRDATSASPPGALFKPGTQQPGDDLDAGQPDVDYKWGRIINVIDAQGNHIEDWTQYDKMFRRPHSVFESPYDPQKDVWIVDDYRHAIFRFSNDDFANNDAAFDSSGNLEPIPYLGAMLGYTHHWSEEWRSTGSYGYVHLDNKVSQADTAYHETHYGSLNLMWQIRKRLWLRPTASLEKELL